MATRIFMKSTVTHPRASKAWPNVTDRYRDMNTVQGASATSMTLLTAISQPERFWALAGNGLSMAFWSERIQTEVTISGPVTCRASATVSGGSHRVRYRLYKVTPNGSDVFTLLGTGETTVDTPTTAGVLDFTMTLLGSVTVAPNERFVVRVSMFRADGANVTTGGTFSFDGPTGAAGDAWLEFPETIVFKPNMTKMACRDTTTIGIGNFMDLSTTFGSSLVNAIVNTVTSGTEVVWTKTAGGAVAEWISPRLKYQWDFPTVTADAQIMFGSTICALESNIAANVAARVKIFVRRTDGTETLVWVDEPTSVELGTTMTCVSGGQASNTPPAISVGEDDRLVARFYIFPAGGTMGGSRTATLGYNAALGASGGTYIYAYDLPDFKAESDPAKSPIVPSGGNMLGLSNGQ